MSSWDLVFTVKLTGNQPRHFTEKLGGWKNTVRIVKLRKSF